MTVLQPQHWRNDAGANLVIKRDAFEDSVASYVFPEQLSLKCNLLSNLLSGFGLITDGLSELVK